MTADPDSAYARHAALTTVHNVLTAIGWDPQPDDETSGFLVDFGPPYLPIATASASIPLDQELFVFCLNFGVAASADRREGVSRFLTFVNWVEQFGCFVMDCDDGFIQFRASLSFRGVELSSPLIENAIRLSMKAVEKYSEPLIDVIARGKDAEQAFQEADATPRYAPFAATGSAPPRRTLDTRHRQASLC